MLSLPLRKKSAQAFNSFWKNLFKLFLSQQYINLRYEAYVKQKFHFVDFAWTPDSLLRAINVRKEKMLKQMSSLKPRVFFKALKLDVKP